MSASFHALPALERHVEAIARAQTPTEVFRHLLAATPCGAPRAAIFLARAGAWKGWGGAGYPGSAGQLLRSVSVPAQEGFLAATAAETSDEEAWREAAAGEGAPGFGQPPAAQTIGVPVRVGGRTVAILVAERGSEEGPWHPEALAIAAHAARLRLEADLAWRRLRAGHDRAEPPDRPVERAPEPEPAVVRPEVETGLEISPWAETPERPGPDPTHEEWRRFAKLVATDIRLYNEDLVQQGRARGDLAARLAEPIQRGRESFSRRFPDAGTEGGRVLRDAFVQVLAGGDATLLPE
ncbi:MAG TPA: GAF domain-containing protein [Candidatus Polarisedimenticolaceae bacterium]